MGVTGTRAGRARAGLDKRSPRRPEGTAGGAAPVPLPAPGPGSPGAEGPAGCPSGPATGPRHQPPLGPSAPARAKLPRPAGPCCCCLAFLRGCTHTP